MSVSPSPSPYATDPLTVVNPTNGLSTLKDVSPLSAACARALNDKIYEKRKAAAMEIEKMTRDFVSVENHVQIQKLIRVLGSEFATSSNSNMRKGGLIGLSAVGIGLGSMTEQYIEDLIRPILTCLTDTDSRVRYYACESLYNVLKVSKKCIIPVFNDVFCSMGMVVADLDQNVRTAAELLDRLLKNAATESPNFNLRGFITVLKERMYSRDPFSRQFHLGWISDLEQIPDSRVLDYLPEIVDPLFLILGDPNVDIYTNCQNILGHFLGHLQSSDEPSLGYSHMINILITHAQSSVGRMQVMSLEWIKVFLAKTGLEMIPFASGILLAALPYLSLDEEQRKALTDVEAKRIKEIARQININLMRLAKSTETQRSAEQLPDPNSVDPDNTINQATPSLNLEAILKVLVKQIEHGKISSKLASLRWTYHLFSITPQKMKSHVDLVFPLLLQALSDQSEEVVINTLQVLTTICNDDGDREHFQSCMLYLLKLFKENKELFETKGTFIVRQLCLLMCPQDIYSTLSKELLEESNLTFARQFVDVLNSILLSTRELLDMRTKLIEMDSQESCDFFLSVYKTWCHSPVAAIALCFLSGFYSHAGTLIRKVSEGDVTIEVLVEIDKLIQYLESPVFSAVRMHLLDVGHNDELLQALYGLLMILPQSDAFRLLQSRLHCVPQYLKALTAVVEKKSARRCSNANLSEPNLMKYFDDIQMKHQEEKRATVKVEALGKGARLLEFD